MAHRRVCTPLQITSITVTATQLNIAIAPVTLLDGQFVKLDLKGVSVPPVADGMVVVITNGATSIPIAIRRARSLLAVVALRQPILCMRYTVDSIVGALTGTVAPCFVLCE